MEKTLFKDLMASIGEAGQIARGERRASRLHVYSQARVRDLRAGFSPRTIRQARKRMHLSQSQLAAVLKISKATLQDWEQGRREPRGPSAALICVFVKKPKAVVEALHG